MLASARAGSWWLFPCRGDDGRGQRRVPSGRFRDPQRERRRRGGSATRTATHGVGGNLGYALAPVVSFGLGAAFGWRVALAAMGVCGLSCWASSRASGSVLTSHRAPDAHLHTLRGSVGAVRASRRSCCASPTSCSRRRRPSGCRRSCRRRSTPASPCRWSSRRRRVTAICSAAPPASSSAGFLAVRTSRPRPRRRDRACCSVRRLLALIARERRADAVDRAGVRRDRALHRRDRPVARPDRAQRDAEGRGGARLRLRLFGPRPRRDARPGLVRHHARSRRSRAKCSSSSPRCFVVAIGTVVQVRPRGRGARAPA